MDEVTQLLNRIREIQRGFRAACRKELEGFGGVPRYPKDQEETIRAHFRNERDKALAPIRERGQELNASSLQSIELATQMSPDSVLTIGERAELAGSRLALAEAYLASLDSEEISSYLAALLENGSKTERAAYVLACRKRLKQDEQRRTSSLDATSPTGRGAEAPRPAYEHALQDLEGNLLGAECERRLSEAQARLDRANELIDAVWLAERDAESAGAYYERRNTHPAVLAVKEQAQSRPRVNTGGGTSRHIANSVPAGDGE